MTLQPISIRPFIGAKDYPLSRRFYTDLGFTETELDANLVVFTLGELSFYLQNAYVKEWVDNTMLFLQVDDVELYWNELVAKNLPSTFPTVRIEPIRTYAWGRECFIHDPSGVLWHVGEFY